MITKERPSIGMTLEHSLPTSLVGNKLIIEVSGLPDFSVGSLNRNNQVVVSFLKDYFKLSPTKGRSAIVLARFTATASLL